MNIINSLMMLKEKGKVTLTFQAERDTGQGVCWRVYSAEVNCLACLIFAALVRTLHRVILQECWRS